MAKNTSFQPDKIPSSQTATLSKRERFLGKGFNVKSAVKRLARKTKSICPIQLRKKSVYVPFRVWEAEYLEKQCEVADSERLDVVELTVEKEKCIPLRKNSKYVPFHVWEAEYLENQRRLAKLERQDDAESVKGQKYIPFHIWEAAYLANHGELAQPEGHDVAGVKCNYEKCRGASEEEKCLTAKVIRSPELLPVRNEKSYNASHTQEPSDIFIFKTVTKVLPKSAHQRNARADPKINIVEEIVESDKPTNQFRKMNLTKLRIQTSIDEVPQLHFPKRIYREG